LKRLKRSFCAPLRIEDHSTPAAAMSELAFANLTTGTYVVDMTVEFFDSEVDGGNRDEEAHEGGGDSNYFHPVGHTGDELQQEQIPCHLMW
jgi:hypothetical protein